MSKDEVLDTIAYIVIAIFVLCLGGSILWGMSTFASFCLSVSTAAGFGIVIGGLALVWLILWSFSRAYDG